MMGSWKTTVGKLLAEDLDISFVDIDDNITEEEEKSIRDIFTQNGKDHFRTLETKMLKQISTLKNAIVSTGGGIVLSKTNRKILSQTGLVILLDANPENIVQRINNVYKRPVLRDDIPLLKQIESIWSERKTLYKDTANIIVDTNDITPKQVVQEIKKILEENYAHR